MTIETIDHSTLTRLVETGSVSVAHIVGQQGGWEVQVTYGALDHRLTAQRSRQVRLFKKLETLVTYLQGVGINRFDVDASSYDPLTIKTYGRPDRSAALKQAHEAAAYDAWFRAQVQASVDDPRPSISDEEARQLFAAKREALRNRAKG
ncbi:antitoxin PaaA2 family protein [Pseudomonas gingeri]|uniref:antitoxin PaaA2 family protein n=1 Tax=Pseudomonas gingeri TaxID=117681 RepID=UPI0015A17899|nr:hypothetical protein [Pseudomonas gingeri]NWA07422.1 hypothetical protein [Pseudomonas gingeri]